MNALLTAGEGEPWPVFDAAGGWSLGLDLTRDLNRYRWGAAAAEVWARLNLIQATPGVSWVELGLYEMQAEETGAVIDAGGEEFVAGRRAAGVTE